MATKRSTTTRVKRDPKTGRFVPAKNGRVIMLPKKKKNL